MNKCFYNNIIVFIYSDGGSITWYEPPPFETVTDTVIIPESNKSLIKGSVDQELSCNFSLTVDLSIITVSMKSGASTIATYLQSQQALSVTPSFMSRFNASWVPNKLTLILLSVTSAEEGEYHCEVVTFGGSVQTWIRKIQVSLLGKFGQLIKRILIKDCYFRSLSSSLYSSFWGEEVYYRVKSAYLRSPE